MQQSLTVFFPAYNDAPTIPGLVARAFQVLESRAQDYEVIVINDGSQDDTGKVLQALAAQYGPHLKIVTHEVNLGYGQALRSGFAAATKDLVFYTDGDGQYDVGELPMLLECLTPSTGLVNGYKLERNDPWHRIWIGNAYNAFAKALFRVRLRDIDCDFRLIRREVLEDLQLTSTSGTICVELVARIEKTGCGIKEVGVHHYPRLHGKSQFFRLRSLAGTFSQLLNLWVRLFIFVQQQPAEARARAAASSRP